MWWLSPQTDCCDKKIQHYQELNILKPLLNKSPKECIIVHKHTSTQRHVCCSFACHFSGSTAQALEDEENLSRGAREMQVISFSLHQEDSSAQQILLWQLSSEMLLCTSVWQGMPSQGMIDLAGCLQVMEPSWEHRAAAQLFMEISHSISHPCRTAVFVNSEHVPTQQIC